MVCIAPPLLAEETDGGANFLSLVHAALGSTGRIVKSVKAPEATAPGAALVVLTSVKKPKGAAWNRQLTEGCAAYTRGAFKQALFQQSLERQKTVWEL